MGLPGIPGFTGAKGEPGLKGVPGLILYLNKYYYIHFFSINFKIIRIYTWKGR